MTRRVLTHRSGRPWLALLRSLAAVAMLPACVAEEAAGRGGAQGRGAADMQICRRQWTAPARGAGAVADNWLATFNDDQLTAAVAEAIAQQRRPARGAARVEQAHALREARRREALSVGRCARARRGQDVRRRLGPAGRRADHRRGSSISGAASATGAPRRAADARSAQADFEYARQSIAALVAKSWFLATEAGLQAERRARPIRDSEDAGAPRRNTLAHRRRQRRRRVHRAGERRQPTTTRCGRSSWPANRPIRALELLLGRYPAAAAAVTAQLPGQPGRGSGGLPSELLERRPDVIAAERRVAAAFNRVREAKAARLPAIALTTGVSSISSELFVLQDHDNPVWNLGANLLAPIYQGRRAQDPGRDPLRRAEAGGRGVCVGRPARVRRGRERAGRRDCRARTRRDSDADTRRQSAGARRRPDAVQSRQHGPSLRRRSASSP